MANPRRLLFVSRDVVGERMAGPGIRYSEMARRLAGRHDVALLAPGADVEERPGFRQYPLTRRRFAELHDWAGVLVSQGFAYPMWTVLTSRKLQIFDLYAPLGLELSVLWGEGERRRQAYVRARTAMLLRRGDLVLCGNEAQRRFWLGGMYAEGRLEARRPAPVAVVPMGVEPLAAAPVPAAWRELYEDASGNRNQVLIWGGGLWDWLDPQAAVRAVAALAPRWPRLRLLFLGAGHPNPELPEFSAAAATRRLAEECGVAGTVVRFAEEWTPYAQRAGLLVNAFAGLSLHRATIEAELALRTRILDYFAAGLPVVASNGDSLGALVAQRGLGAAVAPGDDTGLAAAIERLLADPALVAAARRNVEVMREGLGWEQALAPLLEFLEAPPPPRRRPAADLTRWVRGLTQVAFA